VNKCYLSATGSAPWLCVDEAQSEAGEPFELEANVRNSVADMMEPRPPLVKESSECGVRSQRAQ
jgi:hypothetical protein